MKPIHLNLDTTKLKEALKHLYVADVGLKMGILEGATKAESGDNDATVAEYAFWNEFGTKHIPSRPFLRTTINNKSGKWAETFAITVYGRTTQKGIVKMAIGRVGVQGVADIRATIEDNKFEPNSPITQKLKGSKKIPLKDTTAMFKAIDSEVTNSKGESL